MRHSAIGKDPLGNPWENALFRGAQRRKVLATWRHSECQGPRSHLSTAVVSRCDELDPSILPGSH